MEARGNGPGTGLNGNYWEQKGINPEEKEMDTPNKGKLEEKVVHYTTERLKK